MTPDYRDRKLRALRSLITGGREGIAQARCKPPADPIAASLLREAVTALEVDLVQLEELAADIAAGHIN